MLLLLMLTFWITPARQALDHDTLRAEGRNALLQSRYADAEKILKIAIRDAERDPAVADLDRAILINDLGEAYRCLGRYDEAVRQFKHSIALLRKVQNDPKAVRSLVMVLDNLAALHRDNQEFMRSIEYYKESMNIAQKGLPAN